MWWSEEIMHAEGGWGVLFECAVCIFNFDGDADRITKADSDEFVDGFRDARAEEAGTALFGELAKNLGDGGFEAQI